MNEKLIFFSQAEGTLLIRLLMAHVAADFMLQTTSIVNQKRWFSKYMAAHIVIVFVLTALLSGNLLLSIAITTFHWLIDGIKITIKTKNIISCTTLFMTDQLLHVISIIVAWSVFSHNWGAMIHAVRIPFTNYKCSLILLGYALITTPVGYIISEVTKGMNNPNTDKKLEASLQTQEETNNTNTNNVQHGGKLIGIFERIIILTLVLLAQYSAIGFLITGKSIIRFANNDEHLRSEYVLVGTMMSYALAIMTGALINWLLIL